MKHAATLFSVAVLLPTAASAGAWTQEEGEAYVKAATRHVRANAFYTPAGEQVDITSFGDTTFSVYAEYGWLDDLTLITHLPVRYLTVDRVVGERSGVELNPGGSRFALGDAELAARYRLATLGRSVFAVQAMVGLPLGRPFDPADGGNVQDDVRNALVTGDGEIDQRLELALGHAFAALPVYVSASLGYSFRHCGFSDDLRYGAELGYRFGGWGALSFRAYGAEPFESTGVDPAATASGDDPTDGPWCPRVQGVTEGGTPAPSGSVVANNVRFLAFGPELSFRLWESLGATAAVETLAFGANVFSAPALTLGMTWTP